ncbi:MAG: hypothetical protein AAF483_17390 [Planctomycetota bacterium]
MDFSRSVCVFGRRSRSSKEHSKKAGNRIGGTALERRWEAALTQQRAAEEELNRLTKDASNRLTAAQIEHVQTLSENIPALWHSPTTSPSDRQKIVRDLIEEVTTELIGSSERVSVTIRWVGGYESQHEVARAVGRFAQRESADLIKQRIIQLKRRGHCHEAVAEDLNTQGYFSAQRSAFSKAVVASLVKQFRAAGNSCEAIGGYEGYWTLPLLAKELDVSASTLKRWKDRNWLTAVRSGQRWIIQADPKELARLRQLADHQRGPACRTPPTNLTTPKKSTLVICTKQNKE